MLSVQRKTEVIGRSEYAIVSLNSEVAVLTDWKRHTQSLTLLYPVIFFFVELRHPVISLFLCLH